MMAIDYEQLLHKYINFVGDCEGITFISRLRPDSHLHLRKGNIFFSDEEIEELERLDDKPMYVLKVLINDD